MVCRRSGDRENCTEEVWWLLGRRRGGTGERLGWLLLLVSIWILTAAEICTNECACTDIY